MPGQRDYGMDHPHYAWSPLVERARLTWPKGARMAVCVVVNLERMEWSPQRGSFQTGTLYNRPLPDYRGYSHREYGHRVGIFRVLDVLQKHGITPTIAMDALTARHYPYLVEHCLKRGCEIIGHGIAVSRVISSRMSEAEERDYVRASLHALTEATGKQPQGWLSPDYGESDRTPEILAEEGLEYVCDWGNDEQPYPMTTPEGFLVSLPLLLDLNDSFALVERGFPVHEYAGMIKDACDVIHADSGETGRLFALNVHPWLMGQPFRIGYLDEALRHVMSKPGVWAASGSEIIGWYRKAIDKNS